MTNRPIKRLVQALALGAAILLSAACGGNSAAAPATSGATERPAAASTTGAAAPPATATAAPAAAVANPTAASAPAAQAAVSARVNANSASRAQLQAAFEAAGIPNAGRWAIEVEEYRPYLANDPGFAKLRQQLAKYNPSAEVLEKIIANRSL